MSKMTTKRAQLRVEVGCDIADMEQAHVDNALLNHLSGLARGTAKRDDHVLQIIHTLWTREKSTLSSSGSASVNDSMVINSIKRLSGFPCQEGGPDNPVHVDSTVESDAPASTGDAPNAAKGRSSGASSTDGGEVVGAVAASGEGGAGSTTAAPTPGSLTSTGDASSAARGGSARAKGKRKAADKAYVPADVEELQLQLSLPGGTRMRASLKVEIMLECVATYAQERGTPGEAAALFSKVMRCEEGGRSTAAIIAENLRLLGVCFKREKSYSILEQVLWFWKCFDGEDIVAAAPRLKRLAKRIRMDARSASKASNIVDFVFDTLSGEVELAQKHWRFGEPTAIGEQALENYKMLLHRAKCVAKYGQPGKVAVLLHQVLSDGNSK